MKSVVDHLLTIITMGNPIELYRVECAKLWQKTLAHKPYQLLSAKVLQLTKRLNVTV